MSLLYIKTKSKRFRNFWSNIKMAWLSRHSTANCSRLVFININTDMEMESACLPACLLESIESTTEVQVH